MRSIRSILAVGAASAALVAVAWLPAAALADTDASATVDSTGTPSVESTPSTPATVTPTPSRKMVRTYRRRAAVRLAAFNKDARRLERRINHLSRLATRVHNHGGDVTDVRIQLQKARADLALARGQAKTAAADLRRVPWAVDRKAAIAKANAEFKTARATLRTARADRRQAARLLRPLVREYRVKGLLKADLVL